MFRTSYPPQWVGGGKKGLATFSWRQFTRFIKRGRNMSHKQERPRRLSYAGFNKLPDQKSRRISEGGQLCPVSVLSSSAEDTQLLADSASSSSGISNNSLIPTAMLHDGLNNTSRYDSNKNRPARRISRATDEPFNCSQQSVLSAMDRFVKAVNNMDSTVLVPSRLQDIDVHNENSQFTRCLPANIDNVDVYAFYNMLKEVKNELLWGPSLGGNLPIPLMSGRCSPNSSSTRVSKHVRQASNDSLGSAGFPSDQETDSDLESVITDRDSVEEQSQGSHLATAFRHHLLGLHTILHELADSADYLSTRYQDEIDSAL